MARSTPTPAAGSIAAQLARLNEYRPGKHRVVTCYLKVEPRDRARGKYLIKVKNRVRALESALPELGLERATVEAIRADMARVLDFLKQSGIAAKDVDSDFIEIVPDFNGPRGEDLLEPRFFDVRRGFALRLREVAKFDALLTGMLEAGVDRVQEVEFRTTALRKHRDQARLQAVRAAREKAVALAGELGAKVGKPFSIEETPGGGVRGHGGRRGQAHSQINIEADAPGDATDGDAEQKLAAGMISVTSRVDVVFTLE